MTATRSILLHLAELLGELRVNAAGNTGIRLGRIHGSGHSEGVRTNILDPWITETVATDDGPVLIEYGTVSNIVAGIVRVIFEESGTIKGPQGTNLGTIEWAVWAAHHHATIDAHPAADDLMGEVRRARDTILRIIDPGKDEGTRGTAPAGDLGDRLDDWLPLTTAAQLATHLGHPVSRATAYRWATEDGAPVMRVPSLCVRTRWLIDRLETTT